MEWIHTNTHQSPGVGISYQPLAIIASAHDPNGVGTTATYGPQRLAAADGIHKTVLANHLGPRGDSRSRR